MECLVLVEGLPCPHRVFDGGLDGVAGDEGDCLLHRERAAGDGYAFHPGHVVTPHRVGGFGEVGVLAPPHPLPAPRCVRGVAASPIMPQAPLIDVCMLWLGSTHRPGPTTLDSQQISAPSPSNLFLQTPRVPRIPGGLLLGVDVDDGDAGHAAPHTAISTAQLGRNPEAMRPF